MGAFLGLLPWQVERLTVAELHAYERAQQVRWNRVCAVIAWFLVQAPVLIASGVGHAIAASFSRNTRPLQRVQYVKVLRSIPGYREIDKEGE